METKIDLTKRLSMTPLQKKINKAIKGHQLGEVIHAFEVMKIALLIDTSKEKRSN